MKILSVIGQSFEGDGHPPSGVIEQTNLSGEKSESFAVHFHPSASRFLCEWSSILNKQQII